MARYNLKRKVEIAVRFQPETEVRRKCVRPDVWEAYIAKGPPRARGTSCARRSRGTGLSGASWKASVRWATPARPGW